MTNIYTLSDPLMNEVRYVGKTNGSLANRCFRHTNDIKLNQNTLKNNWIKSLLFKGVKPKIELIEAVSDDCWELEEKFYISYFRYIGIRLTNMTDGGEGMLGNKQSDESKEKRRQANKNQKPSPELLAKMNAARLAKPISESTRLKWCKMVIKKNINGNIISEFSSLLDASKDCQVSSSSLSKAILNRMSGKNKDKIYRNYIWEYKN